MDPVYIANEGKLVAMVPPEQAEAVLAAMQAHPLGQGGGDHRRGHRAAPGRGRGQDGYRRLALVDMQVGEQLPRIC
ncbi:MAG: hypothetical protein R2851_04265 [Caldilineaceae bacterium]